MTTRSPGYRYTTLADSTAPELGSARHGGRTAAAAPPTPDRPSAREDPCPAAPPSQSRARAWRRSCDPTGVEHPRAGGELGRHVQHPLTVGQQPLGDRPSDPVRALDGPHPTPPLPPDPQQLPVAAPVGAEPARGAQHLPGIARLDRDRPLVRVHPDHHKIHHPPPCLDSPLSQRGRATLFRADQQTLLEPRLAAVTGPDAAHDRATPATPVGSRV